MQEGVLGKTRAALFRSGKVSMADFVDDKNRILTLGQLEKSLGLSIT